MELVERALLPPTNALPLTPRPTLVLFGHVTSALYLLEHLVWSHNNAEPTFEVDLDVLKRWVGEMGLVEAVRELELAMGATKERIGADQALVYGARANVNAKL